MSKNQPVQLGLCCVNTILRKQKPPIFWKELSITNQENRIISRERADTF